MAASTARGPAALVVYPRLDAGSNAFADSVFKKLPEFFGKIFRIEECSECFRAKVLGHRKNIKRFFAI
jgi:hypothetical protein